MKRAKKILILGAIPGVVLALIYFLCYTTAEIPASLMKPASPAGNLPGEAYTGLVLKRCRPDTLKPGDLILVNIKSGDQTSLVIRRLEKIEWPDESERVKVPNGRHAASRRVAQTILDMDFKPEYWISSGNEADPADVVRIKANQIKGKVIHTFTKKRM